MKRFWKSNKFALIPFSLCFGVILFLIVILMSKPERKNSVIAEPAKVINLKVTPGIEEAALTWELTSTTNVLHILVEEKLGTGGWTKLPELGAAIRTYTAKSIPAGEVSFRVWVEIKQGSTSAATIVLPRKEEPKEEPKSGSCPSGSTKASSLAEAGKDLETEGTVCLQSGTYKGPTTSEETCGFSVKECWIIKGPASGKAVLIPEGSVSISGTTSILGSHLELKELHLQNVEIGLNVWADRHTNPTDITLENVKGRNFQIQSATHVTIEGGEWGPSSACGGPNSPGGNNAIRDLLEHEQRPEYITINKTVIHDVQSYNLIECHIEGLAIFGGNHVVVSHSKFYGNSVKDVFEQNCCNSNPENIEVTDNWMAATIDNSGANGHVVGYLQNTPALSFETTSNFTLRGNHVNGVFSLNEGGSTQTHSGVTVEYNVAESPAGCDPGVTYIQNVWKGSKCSESDKSVSTLPFTNHANDSLLDYSLTGEYVGWPE